ncbi:MAG: FHIPEP family type III secretion protein [Lewinellaceae bacterium]|nr:FHIPEP family type III secretion protein [Lewinellaceae bacterium]
MPTRFNIDIDLFAQSDSLPPDVAALQRDVAQELTELWPALGLPTEPAVSVHASAGLDHLFDFSLYLGGHPAPVPVFRADHPAAPVSFRIRSAIFAQRARLVTDEQLRLLREQYFYQTKTPPSWSSAPLSVWRALAALLLENGFSLDRLAQCLEHWNPEKSPEEAFERLIENMDALTLTLVVRPESEQDTAGGEAYFQEFYRQVYQDFGIVLPKIQIETSDELPEGHFRLRLNDLWVPVLPGPNPGEALYDGAGADTVYCPVRGYYLQKKQIKNAAGQTPVVDDPWAYRLEWINYWVTRLAAWYVNSDLVETLLDDLEEDNRSLIVMTREQWPTHRLCAVLRYLLREQVSIRNLSEMLDVLLRLDGQVAVDETRYLTFFAPVARVIPVAPGMPDAALTDAQLAGQVRAGLQYPVVFPHLKNNRLPAYGFSESLLRDFREGFFQNAEPRVGTVFHALLQAVSDQTAKDWPRPVFLAPTGIRPAIVAALRPYFPEMVVLGYDEVPPIFVSTVISRIG